MATVKRITDLGQYAGVLPYASQIFGIYQPLLGWKSKLISERFARGIENDKQQMVRSLQREIAPSLRIDYDETGQPRIDIGTGELRKGAKRRFDSLVLDRIGESLPRIEDYDASMWSSHITHDILDNILKKDVVAAYTKAFGQLRELGGSRRRFDDRTGTPISSGADGEVAAFEKFLARESQIAGMLQILVNQGQHEVLKGIFYVANDSTEQAGVLARMLSEDDPATATFDLNNLDPTDAEQLKGVALSPISVVHLFRQYFFELDTFLGTPERHVWLSPGSSVELIEVHTRKTTIERTLETSLDILTKSETATTTQDEISEAVKDENSSDIKAGASVTASYASVQATASFDYASSQKQARETTHKRTREQTEKLSSEIRKNFKSTFKSTTEVTDTSSTRHLLANNTSSLINYELRRKMRQVGVQLQDIGTYLCWQTYVDDPGASLGLGKLVHIAKPAELDAIPHPQELPSLQPFQEEKLITIPFISADGTNADNEGEVYVNGIETDNSEFRGSEEHIQSRFHQEFVCPRLDYQLTDVAFDGQGKPITVSRASAIDNSALPKASFTINLDSADFQGQNSLQVQLILYWSPLASANQEIDAKNKALQDQFNAAEKAAFEKAAVETLKERVDVISKLKPRPGDDMREEERIVIYRQLIQGMLQKNIPMPDDQTRHVVAELINSIFDVDKMLYFVSPEWWRPRLHRSAQQLKETPEPGPRPLIGVRGVEAVLNSGVFAAARNIANNSAPTLTQSSTVGWGGVDDPNRDNYYITSDSEPAKMGSSLGWLLQLDGDNMRNAFLNAPWVKAVMPIRPGKEKAAINWLKGVEGMNGITDDVIYHSSTPGETDVDGDPLEGQPLIDVLFDLAEKIRRKHEDGIKMGTYPKSGEVIDPALADPGNTVTATPVDRVYEHGFFPLEGSFRANVGGNYEIFDQWTEVLPTDQIVPVEVAYDPKTGRQI
ncbi:MAG TPA: hypothetical protein VFD22_08715 [Gemmatimonadaceae bacterium]|nr:hypothetical protein [Gemmatimonadaceae bacterium]